MSRHGRHRRCRHARDPRNSVRSRSGTRVATKTSAIENGASSSSTSREPTVLIVEDDPDTRYVLELRLADAFSDIQIVVADSALHALETATRMHPTAVVLDLGLRDMDGFEFANRLRAVTTAARTIVLTGDGRLETRERAAREGFAAFLVKPEGVDDLIAVLRTLLDSDRGASIR